MTSDPTPPRSRFSFLAGITRNIWVLGLVSLFNDIGSEMIIPVRMLFLVGVLNTPLPIAGLIEGLAASIASFVNVLAGQMSDRVSGRKPLILSGYALSGVVKPLLAFVGTWPPALGLILVDRFGKGLRTSPRDALIADSTPPENRGKAFGLHRALDTLGAAIGPLIAFAILALTRNDMRQVFLWTAVPGVLSVLLLALLLRERRRQTAPVAAEKRTSGSDRASLRLLGSRFWLFTAIATIFALGNSSDAFIFLKTEGLENSLAAVPLVYFGYNVVYALLATPLGALSDRWGRLPVLTLGFAAFGAVYAGWAVANQPWHGVVLFLVYGIYAAATEGLGKAFVTDLVGKERRGAGLGWFNAMTGLAALPANVLGGWLWALWGSGATFAFGAAAGFLSAALMLLFASRLVRPREAQAGGTVAE